MQVTPPRAPGTPKLALSVLGGAGSRHPAWAFDTVSEALRGCSFCPGMVPGTLQPSLQRVIVSAGAGQGGGDSELVPDPLAREGSLVD